jgi:hypothetical protein
MRNRRIAPLSPVLATFVASSALSQQCPIARDYWPTAGDGGHFDILKAVVIPATR